MNLGLILAVALQATTMPAVSDAAGDADKKICRKEVQTGTRLAAKKRCQTQAQWDAETEESRANYEAQRRFARGRN